MIGSATWQRPAAERAPVGCHCHQQAGQPACWHRQPAHRPASAACMVAGGCDGLGPTWTPESMCFPGSNACPI
jgi:hypothetical protein